MVRETVLTKNDLIYPLFVVPGKNVNKPVKSMPGVLQLSVENLVKNVKKFAILEFPL
jgi:porphobilinogen synthase